MSSKTPQNYKDILQISSRINNVILLFSKEKVGVSLDSILPELNTIKQNIEDVIRDKSL